MEETVQYDRNLKNIGSGSCLENDGKDQRRVLCLYTRNARDTLSNIKQSELQAIRSLQAQLGIV
jgi:hypothetical protein